MTASLALDVQDEYTKVISISPKHQITIPRKFFSVLRFGTEAVCTLKDNEIVIRPFRSAEEVDFSEQILVDLVAQGYSGEKLVEEFRLAKGKVKTAVKLLIQDAENAANGIGEFYTEDDVFGEED